MVAFIELCHNPLFRIRDTLFEFTNPDYRTRIRKSKMTLGKSVSAAGFEIQLEGDGFFLGLKSEVGFHLPRAEFFRMRDIALVVLGPSGFQILRRTDITLIGNGKRPKYIRVKHGSIS